MDNLMKLHFDDAAISDITDINPSFATGKLTVMYTGTNPNGTSFSRGVVEAALPTMKNVPIVAHYDMDENEIGSHDIDVVADKEGNYRIRNLTEPCGVVPESASIGFVNKMDSSGNVHEYLEVEPVILWKRQEVYNHIINDLGGKVDHSMEVNVRAYHKDKESKVLIVDDFEFQALCLLESAAPCFSGSALEIYAASEFKNKMAEMMAELKEAFSLNADKFNLLNEEVNIKTDFETKGGDEKLEDKLALIEKYGITVDELDFSIDDYSIEELEAKLAEMKFDDDPPVEGSDPVEPDDSDETPSGDNDPEPDPEPEEEPEPEAEDTDESIEGNPSNIKRSYELDKNLRQVIDQAVRANDEQISLPWGYEPRYQMQDFDDETGIVYTIDCKDWNLYGFSYYKDGDNVSIDWNSKKRMKVAYVEFNDGDQDYAISETFSHFDNKYQEVVGELTKFKLDIENKAAAEAREATLAKFEDLSEFDAFNELKEHADEYSIDALEEKCYALRGKLGITMKFSAAEKSPKLKVVKNDLPGEPYGGLFVRYGIGENN